MSKLNVVLSSLLVVVLAISGFIYWQQSDDLNSALDDVNSLNSQVTSLESTASSFSTEIAGLNSSFTSLQNDLLLLEGTISGMNTSSENSVNIVSQVSPAVVRIRVSSPPTRNPGTGIIITQDGYILTNEHVITGNSTVTVYLVSGESYQASVVASDAEMDLAILKINAGRASFPAVTLGNYDDITIGQRVLAFGYPYSYDLGDELAVVDGIVSSFKTQDGYEYIQSDTEISQGYGGGPIVNMDGEVIGLTTWAFTAGEGLKFAIPVNNMKSYIEQVIGTIA